MRLLLSNIPWNTFILLILILLNSLFMFGCTGEEIVVPEDYNSIQKAINNADDGDIVRVNPGTYRENIDFKGKNIEVTSVDPQDRSVVQDTVIEGGNGSVVKIENSKNAVLNGFVITNGKGTERSLEFEDHHFQSEFERPVGGGVFILESESIIIKNNIIKDNYSEYGGGIFAGSSTATIKGNLIKDNHTNFEDGSDRGGGIAIISSEANIEDNRIKNNSSKGDHGFNPVAGAGIYLSVSTFHIEDNEIIGNKAEGLGGGITAQFSEGTVKKNIIKENINSGILISVSDDISIKGNEIYRNESHNHGGGTMIGGAKLEFKDNVLKENTTDNTGGGIAVLGDSKGEITNNDFQGNFAEDKGDSISILDRGTDIDLETEADDIYIE